SPASDWYAFGVILYEALTGRPPFEGKLLEVLMNKQQFDPLEPRSRAPGIPDDLNRLCMELLRRELRDRPAGRDIQRLLGTHPVAAEPADSVKLPQTPEAALIGRERPLRALREALDATRQGRTVRLCVHGRSGVGK